MSAPSQSAAAPPPAAAAAAAAPAPAEAPAAAAPAQAPAGKAQKPHKKKDGEKKEGDAKPKKEKVKKDKKGGDEKKDEKAPAPKEKDWFIDHRIKVWEECVKKRQEEAKTATAGKKIKVVLPNGSALEGEWQAGVTTPMDICKKISNSLAQKVLAAKIEPVEVKQDAKEAPKPVIWDLSRPLEDDCKITLLDFESKEGSYVFWHSSAHILGQALEIEYPGSRLCVGPPIEDGGFYYDLSTQHAVSDTEFKAIEKTVSNIIKQKQKFERLVLKKDEALEMFKDNKFKCEIIRERVPDGAVCTAYRCGPLIDLCKGPHLPDTARVKALAVTKNSSCYWKGDATKDTLQRVYGISFPDAKRMEEYQARMEAALARDHRKLGAQQKLFFHHELSPGSTFFLPHGARVYNTLIEFIRGEYRNRGYTEVITPNVFNVELWKCSGHYQHYKENMFLFECEKQEFAMKPMNCPGHCLMFGHGLVSWRDLPIRYADFGVLHRNEISGALTGLTRVRRFQQDDAHIFCMPDQIESEVAGVLDMLKTCYSVFGFDYELSLSTRPKDSIGDEKSWNQAEKALADCLDKFCKSVGKKAGLNPGDGAFYGPKIDIQLYDALKRKHQCATIQLDFNLPERFNLSYKGTDGGFHRPVIIHRAILGSVERMMAVLIEHCAGKWPFWLSPRQACIIPTSIDNKELLAYGREVTDLLKKNGFYVEFDDSTKQLNYKIRECFLEAWNYNIVVGQKEITARTVTITPRDNAKSQETISLDALLQLFLKLRDSHQ